MFPTMPTITPTMDLLTQPIDENERRRLSDVHRLVIRDNAAVRLAERRARRLTLAATR